MDLLKRKKEREKNKELEKKHEEAKQEVFKKPQKAYAPTSKKFTVFMFVVFAALIIYFILTSKILAKDSCGIIPGIECTDLELSSDSMSFVLHNYLKEEMNVTISIEGCEETVSRTMKPNTKADYSFSCANDKVVKKEIYITHVGYSGLPHEKVGKVTGTVE